MEEKTGSYSRIFTYDGKEYFYPSAKSKTLVADYWLHMSDIFDQDDPSHAPISSLVQSTPLTNPYNERPHTGPVGVKSYATSSMDGGVYYDGKFYYYP